MIRSRFAVRVNFFWYWIYTPLVIKNYHISRRVIVSIIPSHHRKSKTTFLWSSDQPATLSECITPHLLCRNYFRSIWTGKNISVVKWKVPISAFFWCVWCHDVSDTRKLDSTRSWTLDWESNHPDSWFCPAFVTGNPTRSGWLSQLLVCSI